MRKFLILTFITLPTFLAAQSIKLSDQAQVSLITCGPSTELDALFGHSGFRVYDPVWSIDKVYDYGGFDFDTPNFYVKFTLGKLLYNENVRNWDRFLAYYEYTKRWVNEQILDIGTEDKQAIYEFLEWNLKPENRYYKYDFFFDNCATKMRDILKDVLGDRLSFRDDHLTEENSFRDLLRSETASTPWISMGMDIALGTKIDPNATLEEHMFLPDYVLSNAGNAYITENGQTRPLIKSERMVYDPQIPAPKAGFFNPLVVFSILALIVLSFTVKDIKQEGRSRILDFILLFITGFLGLAVVFLWVGTEHDGMRNNLNILWAFLPNLYVAFLALKKSPPKWVRGYVRLLFILLIMMTLVWLFSLQVYAVAFIPIMIMLGVRYLFLWQKGLA